MNGGGPKNRNMKYKETAPENEEEQDHEGNQRVKVSNELIEEQQKIDINLELDVKHEKILRQQKDESESEAESGGEGAAREEVESSEESFVGPGIELFQQGEPEEARVPEKVEQQEEQAQSRS